MQDRSRSEGLMEISADHLRWSFGLCACASFENVYHLHFQLHLFSLIFLCFHEKKEKSSEKENCKTHVVVLLYARFSSSLLYRAKQLQDHHAGWFFFSASFSVRHVFLFAFKWKKQLRFFSKTKRKRMDKNVATTA
jgi:hypothetical protein